ncbi:MAG: hypothetical protein KDD82_01315 [Planctomycetes bacterium]|nr:hypothetical protein [Planctomycetota bacterium]
MNGLPQAIAAVCALCSLSFVGGCAQDTGGKTVAGRTRSISNVQSGTSNASDAQLTLLRRRDQATGQERYGLVTALAGAGSQEAILRLPNGEEQPLALTADGALGLELELPQAPLAGAYTFLWFDALGSRRSLSLVATADFPPYPEITTPTERALVAPSEVSVAWTWDGGGGLFALTARQTLPVAEDVVTVEDLAELGATIPQLVPGSRYLLEVSVGDVPAGRAVRWVSASQVEVDTLQ